MKRLIIFLIVLLLMSCDDTVQMNEAQQPIHFDHSDIKDLECINKLIFENVDLLMDSARNHYDLYPTKDDPKRYQHFYFTKPWMLKKYLPKRQTIDLDFLDRHSSEHKDKLRNFKISEINFRPSDGAVSYNIGMFGVGDVIVLHQLWHKIPRAHFKIYEDQYRRYAKKYHKPVDRFDNNITKINETWTYLVRFNLHRSVL